MIPDSLQVSFIERTGHYILLKFLEKCVLMHQYYGGQHVVFTSYQGPSNSAEWRGWFSGLVVRHLTGNQESWV